MRYINICPIVILLFLSGCANIFPRNKSADQDIPQAKVRPYAYSGLLKRNDSFWKLPFGGPDYDYYIADKKGNKMAFLDISELAIGTSLADLVGKTVTVNGQTFPHRYCGIIIIKAKHIILAANRKN
jgi:hypothetical protein